MTGPGTPSRIRPLDLTVAICAHNARYRIHLPLRALADQRSTAAWEVLVIDNASTDATAAAAESAATELGLRCRVVHEPEVGLINARRCAASEAQGRIISYVDDDNLVDPSWVDECVALWDRRPGVGVAGGRIDPEFETPGTCPPDFQERFAMALAIRDFGPNGRRLTPPADDPPCGAGMTGPTALFCELTRTISPQLTDRCGKRLSSGGDTELGLLAHHLGYELWYEPRLRMRHLLPASRLTQAYLDRLIVGGSTAGPWLDYLRGKEQRRSRTGYAIRAAREASKGVYMSALGFLRRRGHAHSARYPVWAGIHLGTARGYAQLYRRYPFDAIDASLKLARERLRAIDQPASGRSREAMALAAGQP